MPLPALQAPLPHNACDPPTQQHNLCAVLEPSRQAKFHTHSARPLPPEYAGRESSIGASNSRLKNHVQLVAQCLKTNKTFAAVANQEERSTAWQGAGSADTAVMVELRALRTLGEDVRALVRAQGGTLQSLHSGQQ